MRQLVIAATALLIGAACASGSESPTTTSSTTTSTVPPPPTSTTTTTRPSTTTSTVPPIEWDFSPSETAPELRLIDAGSEPRTIPVYDLTAGTGVESSMRLDFSILQLLDGEVSTDVSTTVDFELTAEVIDVVPEGFIIETTFGEVQVRASDPTSQTALDQAYAFMRNASMKSLVAPSGQILAVSLDVLLGDLSDVSSALAGSVGVLPAVPVGIGAVWEIVSEIEVQGIVLTQTSTTTLTDFDGSVMVVEIDLTQELGPDGLTFPGLDPEDVEADLSSVGFGTAVWDLSLPFAVRAISDVTQLLEVTASIGEEESMLAQTSIISSEIPSPGAFSPPEGTVNFQVADRAHTDEPVEYEQDPPVGGIHASVWQNCGFYGGPVDNENAVHSLEHGAVWITYAPGLSEGEQDVLRVLAAKPYVLVSPYPGLDTLVVVSAWGAQLRLDTVFDPRLTEFVDWFAEGPQTPEPGAPCSEGIGDPE